MRRHRRAIERDEENLERWLVSYADFITLLFAFFVVMYAVSAVNEGKYRVLSSALGAAFGGDVVVSRSGQTEVIKTITVPAKPNLADEQHGLEAKKMDQVAKDLSQTLAPLVKQGVVRVSQTSRGVDVEINASLLFPSGSAGLTPDSKRALQAIASILKDQQYLLEVDGYSDDQPIKSTLFPSNWELSAVRASSVARQFALDGIAEGRLKVVGYGSNQPIVPNDTEQDRAKNRRVEVMVLAPRYEAAREITYPTGTTH